MKHTHLESCPSTQFFLKGKLSALHPHKKERFLVSTRKQTAGIGRLDHKWEHFDNALAFSCLFYESEFKNPISLFIASALAKFFHEKFQTSLFLKWPNDLFTVNKKKCGGILCHQEKEFLIVGIGLNWGKIPSSFFNAESLFPSHEISDQKYSNLPQQIYTYLLEQISHQDRCIQEWEKYCCHMNKKVRITNANQSREGFFQGINEDGAAIIDGENVYSGSLEILF